MYIRKKYSFLFNRFISKINENIILELAEIIVNFQVLS